MTASTATIAYATSPRLYVTAALSEGAMIEATPRQVHYLGTVLRRGSGDVVRLFNGSDGEWIAAFNAGGRRASLAVEQRTRPQQAETGPWLVFALLKRDATDLVVRQAVELGASRLLPVITERTNAARVTQDRLRAIAIEAAEQCERLTVPQIDTPQRLTALLTAWPPDRRLFAAIERSGPGQTLLSTNTAIARSPPGQTLLTSDTAIERSTPGQTMLSADTASGVASALLIGPEGGFSAAEQDYLCRFDFIMPISLGPTILRAETAAVAGLALLLAMGQAEYAKPT
jgi:16S rRNA (uracil1498-N3)-methyltransferase